MGNLIKGQKPEFGNIEQIKWLRGQAEIFNGEINFHTIEWQPGIYIGGGGTSRPTFKRAVSPKEIDCLYDYIPCPKCNRYHVLLVCIDKTEPPTEYLIEADNEAKEFECWNCGLEFETDDERNVYVKQTEL